MNVSTEIKMNLIESFFKTALKFLSQTLCKMAALVEEMNDIVTDDLLRAF